MTLLVRRLGSLDRAPLGYQQQQQHDPRPRLLERLERLARYAVCLVPPVTPELFSLLSRHGLPVFCFECSSADAIVWGRTSYAIAREHSNVADGNNPHKWNCDYMRVIYDVLDKMILYEALQT